MKLISCNIEANRHLNRVADLVAKEAPDAICLQEVLDCDLPWFEEQFGMSGFFAPMFTYDGVDATQGVAIFARAFNDKASVHYAGEELAGPLQYPNDKFELTYQRSKIQLVTGTVVHDNHEYHLTTTHLPVTFSGQSSWFQNEAIKSLLAELEKLPELILTGDLNAPRGRAAFSMLSDLYEDNIPQQYQTSIDGDLHRSGPIPLMVDGLFTTTGYRTKNVRLINGISDHCAIVAEIYPN